MSVVIIGGHDRMVCQYKKICRQFNCKANATHRSSRCHTSSKNALEEILGNACA